MEYPIIQGMEEPVRIKGFLLPHFYMLLGVLLLCSMLILGSFSSSIEAGSISPLIQNVGLSALLFGVAFPTLRYLSSPKPFSSMGPKRETDNMALHERLFPHETFPLWEEQELRRLADLQQISLQYEMNIQS